MGIFCELGLIGETRSGSPICPGENFPAFAKPFIESGDVAESENLGAALGRMLLDESDDSLYAGKVSAGLVKYHDLISFSFASVCGLSESELRFSAFGIGVLNILRQAAGVETG
jgi:hypothetical protein